MPIKKEFFTVPSNWFEGSKCLERTDEPWRVRTSGPEMTAYLPQYVLPCSLMH
jgi:hypothetical protein